MSIQNMKLHELVENYLSEDSVKEFDSIVNNSKRKNFHWIASLSLAASVAIFFLIGKPDYNEAPAISNVDLIRSIRQFMEINTEEIQSITAKPNGPTAILTAQMKDGSTYTYIMSYNEDNGSTSIVAMNNNQ